MNRAVVASDLHRLLAHPSHEVGVRDGDARDAAVALGEAFDEVERLV